MKEILMPLRTIRRSKEETEMRMRANTVIKNYPLSCPKCNKETLIDAIDLKVTVLTDSDTETKYR